MNLPKRVSGSQSSTGHRVLIHGYGLLDERRALSAGSGMSGLTLYNTLLADGLARHHTVAFLTGRIGPVAGVVERRLDRAGRRVFEYDASFPELLEPQGRFLPRRAALWYRRWVDRPDNPVYRHLTRVYHQVLEAFRPQVVNPHNLNAAVAYVRTAPTLASPPRAVVTLHDIFPRQLAFVARRQHHVHRFVAVSRSVAEALEQAGIDPARICHIPNGLELEPFMGHQRTKALLWSRIARREGLKPVPFQVLVPARRVPGKGMDDAIEGFARFRRETGLTARLLISGANMGEKGYEARLRRQVRASGLGSTIHFLGPVNYTEMPALFAACQVSLLPSTVEEGFGYVNLEAMASDGPVVVTSGHGGCLDYMAHGVNGLLVSPRDADAIADVLARLARHPTLRARLRAGGRVTARRYTVAAMVAAYQALLAA